jgi:hypothetical protein
MLMDLLAGIVAGLVMASVFLAAAVFFLFTHRDTYDRLAKRLPPGLSPTALLLLILFGIPSLWGLAGAVGGLLYHLADSSHPGTGLASPNSLFTLVVLCLAALAALVVLVVRRRPDPLGLAITVAFAGIFGWLLPFLATWR